MKKKKKSEKKPLLPDFMIKVTSRNRHSLESKFGFEIPPDVD
jgi:hypothetical protein